MSEKTLPEAGRAFVFRTPEGRKGASGTIWGKILCAEGQTGGKQVYPLSRREAKKLIPVQMVKRVLAILPILFLACALPAQELDPVTKWATVAALKYPVSFNVVYQKSNTVSLRLDVINAGPRTETRPTLIYMHGGGWVEGTKESTLLYALPYLAKGMNVVNVEYRMAPESLAPAAVEDCRCALHWVYQHAGDYGFDTNKLVVAGHSAGGHLALMTGMLDPSAGFDNGCQRLSHEWRLGIVPDVKVAAIIDFFGPTDLVDLTEGENPRNYAIRWFGSLPNRADLAKQMSPLTYAHRGLPPTLIIHGDRDPIVPYQQALHWHEALDKAGVPSELLTISGGHGQTTPYAWTLDQQLQAQEGVFKFLKAHGILSK